MATSKRVRRKVHCSRCANLLLVLPMMPLCVATCKLVSGPLRKVIDIKGMASAEKRNKSNNCSYFVRYSLHAAKLKRVALAMVGTDLKVSALREYSIEQERKTKYGKRDGSNNKEYKAAEQCISEQQQDLESEIFGAEERTGEADAKAKAGSADEESSSDGGQKGAEGKETVEKPRRSGGEEKAGGGDAKSGRKEPSPLEEYTGSLSEEERAALIE